MKVIYLLVVLLLFIQHSSSSGLPSDTGKVRLERPEQKISHASFANYYATSTELIKYKQYGETVAGGNGSGSLPFQLSGPAGIFVDSKGAVYVADNINHRVQKFPQGAVGITVAGGNGQGSVANQLSYPTGVFVDASGNIYVADEGNHRIQKWSPGALAGITVAGGNGRGMAANQLNFPTGVFVDSKANIYIADQENHRVQKWTAGATTGITVAGGNGRGMATTQLANPRSIFVDETESLYVADVANSRVQKFTAGNQTGITVAGGNGEGSASNQLAIPITIFVDATGNIYIAEVGNNRIQKWAPGSATGTTIIGRQTLNPTANQLTEPWGIFLDPSSNIYVSEYVNHRVQKFSVEVPGSSAIGITVAGGNRPGSAANQLSFVTSVFVDATGNVFACDRENHRIQKWAPGASVGTTVAGGTGQGSAANQLSMPNRIFVDVSGNIYVSDFGNNRIQKWTLGASAGITVAGGNGPGSAANQLSSPTGVVVDATGNIFVGDFYNYRIQKWAPGALEGTTVAGGNGLGPAANQIAPADIAVDATGNIFVLDAFDLNGRVQKWAPGAVAGITVAGGRSYGSAADQVYVPVAIFVDTKGDIYITDRGNNRIQKWVLGSSTGITAAGGNGAGTGTNQIQNPGGVFVDNSGNIYVADEYNFRVQKFSVPAPMTGSPAIGFTVAGGNGAGSSANQISYGTGIFVDAAENLFVADATNNRIQKWAPGASESVVVAGGNALYGAGANQLYSPSGVFVDVKDNVFVADANNHRIQKWPAGATVGITVAGGNSFGAAANQLSPADVFVDLTGNIYAADHFNNRIQKWLPGASSGITVAGGNGIGAASNQLHNPVAVFVDASGNIYITDRDNHRIQKWAPGASSGITVAGGNGYGTGANQLTYPEGIFVDGKGTVYIADGGNHRIQKWAAGASVGVTVAGGNGAGFAGNQLYIPSDVAVDTHGSVYVADLYNYRVQKFVVSDEDVSENLLSCPTDLLVNAASCNERTTIEWTEPRDSFPANIKIPEELDPGKGNLTFIGTFNGHGYYKSKNAYSWPVAREITNSGGDDISVHLVTINSAAENDFIFNNIKRSGYAPWIGLSNTGRRGRFRWVTREPLDYTNWAAAEPNNAGGYAKNIEEPYTRLSDLDGKWNDQRDDFIPFIAEFEKPLVRYKQISGPRNGSRQKTGVYQVCYEMTNVITSKKDTCCFSVTITCNAQATDVAAAGNSIATDASELNNARFRVLASPNPSRYNFRLLITGSNSKEVVTLRVSDIAGRVIESKKGLTVNQTLEVGNNYKPGVYFVQVMQGTRKIILKLVKE